MTAVPHRLMVEHLVAPVGTSVRRPRLSWWLPDGASAQEAFQVQAGSWDSGRVDGRDHLLVRYEGPEPAARERVEWRVKVWTDLGESEWSDRSWWEVGLLDPSDWSARWVSPVEDERPPAGDVRMRFPRSGIASKPACGWAILNAVSVVTRWR